MNLGEGKVKDRLSAHAKKLEAQTAQGSALAAAAPIEFSFVLDELWLSHHRLELETDLIGAHVISFQRPPPAQFIG